MIDYGKSLPLQIAALSQAELLETARHGTDAARALALGELARLAATNAPLAEIVLKIATQPENMEARLMGTISVAHYALTEVLRANPQAAPNAVIRLLANWPEPDRGDFIWHLKSELGRDALAYLLEAA